MIQQEVKEESVEVEAEEFAISPAEEVTKEAEVDIGKMMSALSWAPLENESLEAHAEEIITGILEKIPGLMVKTSPNQHQAISIGKTRGRVVAKAWFSKKKVVLETAVLEGRKYSVLKSRELNDKNGLSKTDRSAVIREIKKFVADRGW